MQAPAQTLAQPLAWTQRLSLWWRRPAAARVADERELADALRDLSPRLLADIGAPDSVIAGALEARRR